VTAVGDGLGPALEAEGIAMGFGATPVLHEVDLVVPPQSVTAVLGASGSGKTTLLRVLAGFERPQAGRVRLAGRVVTGPGTHQPPERRGIGYVPQEAALFPHLTVAGNVAFGLRRRQRSPARVAELLELVSLPGLGRRYPHELSGGQQQRVALARALAVGPSVVLLDEPFSSLDAALRVSVRTDIMRVLRATQTPVVLVTHDQQEAISLADQVAVLRDGRVAQAGRPQEVYTQPADPALAAFLGAANLVTAHVRGPVADTAFGPLTVTTPIQGEAVVLVRPEQISITAAGATPASAEGDGLTGRVTEQSYQGHETLVTVCPDRPGGPGPILVRVPGPGGYPPGTPVRLTATGPVAAYSRSTT
jgi:iron(III) transport system ATP-binding protein